MLFISNISDLMSLKLKDIDDVDYVNDKISSFEELEKKEILKAIKKYGNTTEGMKKTADALNIGIATLYRKIKKYDIK